MTTEQRPRLLVFSTLFPHAGQPNAGVFIRERMFRVGKCLPLVVVAPQPWFPFQGLLRRWRPHFRPSAPRFEIQEGVKVYHPRFISVPGLFKGLDGLFLTSSAFFTLFRIKRSFRFDLIDSHFTYPDGYAATLLGRYFRVPVSITLRGTEVPQSRSRSRRRQLLKGLARATRVISVSDSLKQHMVALGAEATKIMVVGNGVDVKKFYPIAKATARQSLGIPESARVLITVGGLVERKGFHRVIELLPGLREFYPDLYYLVVGGAGAEGDWGERLREMSHRLGLNDVVRFLGTVTPTELRQPLSAADLFVLPTRNEGWANVILEAMACGLPVIATDVGGNSEVVADASLGSIVPFGDSRALHNSIRDGLERQWDRERIIGYAEQNSWDSRVEVLVDEFRRLTQV